MPSSPMPAVASGNSTIVPVALGERGYDIHIGPGLLERAGDLAGPLLARPFTVIVTDENVAEAHLPGLQDSLKNAGILAEAVVLPAGEGTKSFAMLEKLTDRLLALKVERGDTIIALGGGVIGDLAGFAAAILRRGVDFIQIPTSLLAQVDSSVGGKTGISTPRGKNLIGAFHQPRLVLADIAALDTLPLRQLRAGYGEVVKYGALGDAAFFAWLETNGPAILRRDHAALTEAVARCCRAKAGIVARDEREGGERALLNLGHTFGHALEAETGYSDRLLHGEAVAIGMVQAFDYAHELGLCPAEDGQRLRRHLAASGLPVDMSALGLAGGEETAERLLEHIGQDKKVKGGQLTFILARGIGKAFISRDIDAGHLLEFLKRQLSATATTKSS